MAGLDCDIEYDNIQVNNTQQNNTQYNTEEDIDLPPPLLKITFLPPSTMDEKCSICHEPYTQIRIPIASPCNHEACELCWRRYCADKVSNVYMSALDTVTCQMCRAIIPISFFESLGICRVSDKCAPLHKAVDPRFIDTLDYVMYFNKLVTDIITLTWVAEETGSEGDITPDSVTDMVTDIGTSGITNVQTGIHIDTQHADTQHADITIDSESTESGMSDMSFALAEFMDSKVEFMLVFSYIDEICEMPYFFQLMKYSTHIEGFWSFSHNSNILPGELVTVDHIPCPGFRWNKFSDFMFSTSHRTAISPQALVSKRSPTTAFGKLFFDSGNLVEILLKSLNEYECEQTVYPPHPTYFHRQCVKRLQPL